MNPAGIATVGAVEGAGEPYPGERLVSQVGQIVRSLHDSLRELGYDKVPEETAAKIPDARERLAYVADMTRHAARTRTDRNRNCAAAAGFHRARGKRA